MNYSTALPRFVRDGQVKIDGVEVGPYFSPGRVRQVRQELPSHPFYFHPNRLGVEPGTLPALKAYLEATGSPWVSPHLSLLPPLVVWLGLRFHIYLRVNHFERLESNFIKRILALKKAVDLPVILENMPGHPAHSFTFHAEPQRIRRVLERTGCRMLLDLAHARVSAALLGMTPETYLGQLPLEQVAQVHVSGPRVKDGLLSDAHEPMLDEDYRLLEYTLARCTPEVVTLEYFREPQPLLEQIQRITHILSLYGSSMPSPIDRK